MNIFVIAGVPAHFCVDVKKFQAQAEVREHSSITSAGGIMQAQYATLAWACFFGDVGK